MLKKKNTELQLKIKIRDQRLHFFTITIDSRY